MVEQNLIDAMIAMMERSTHDSSNAGSGGFNLALQQNDTLRRKLQGFPEPQRARLLAIVEEIRRLLQNGKDDVDERY
jgi:hypothetical protein